MTELRPLPMPPQPWLRRLVIQWAAWSDYIVRQRLPTTDEVLRQAERALGTTDWGFQDVREPIEQLLVALRAVDTELSPLGRRYAADMLKRVAREHLQVVQAIQRAPQVLDQPVVKPMFIVGLPRTGTTLLYNLLSCDPRRRPLYIWEGNQPVNPRWTGRSDWRRWKTKQLIRLLHLFLPDLSHVHYIDPTGPEECFPLLHRTFVSGTFTAVLPVDDYLEWLLQDGNPEIAPAYRFYKAQLQLLQQDDGQPPRSWILKNPAHICTLQALTQAFPDACIIQTHRDLTRVTPSWLSMTRIMRSFTLARPELQDHQRSMTNYARVMRKAIAAREAAPHLFTDVQFRQLVKDPLGTIHKIYESFGMSMSADHEVAAARWIRENPQHKHGKHSYTLEEFGLTADKIRRDFAFYSEYFGVQDEG